MLQEEKLITLHDLISAEERVNSLLKNVKIQVGMEHGYFMANFCRAEDYDPVRKRCRDFSGRVISRLTRREMLSFLQALEDILSHEFR